MSQSLVLPVEGGVPIHAWVEGVEFEHHARAQLQNVARLPFVFRHVAVMPDVHAGIGATVGTVLATLGAIVPAAVGVDIGCGMMAVQTTLNAKDLPDSLASVRHTIEAAVPHGRSHNGGKHDAGAWSEVPDSVEAAWAELYPGYRAVLAKNPRSSHPRPLEQLGTLGGGNHFVEVCLDEAGSVWVMLHSGSRGVGNSVGSCGVPVVTVRRIRNVPARRIASGRRIPRIAVAVPIRVLVPGRRIDRVAFVRCSVAVVVDLVADLRRGGVYGTGGVITVRGVGDVPGRHVAGGHGCVGVAKRVGVAVGVPIAGCRGAVINRTVAIVIDLVADFRRSRVYRSVPVVAVLASGPGIAIAIVKANRAIAVVVVRIGAVRLDGAGVVGCVAVIAIAAERHRIGWWRTRVGFTRVVPIPIPIAIGVPGGRLAVLIHIAITVVVDSIADLGRGGVYRAVGVVTIGGIRHVARGCIALLHRVYSWIAVAVVIAIVRPGGNSSVLKAAVAVAVHIVAREILGIGVDRGVGVVAIAVCIHDVDAGGTQTLVVGIDLIRQCAREVAAPDLGGTAILPIGVPTIPDPVAIHIGPALQSAIIQAVLDGLDRGEVVFRLAGGQQDQREKSEPTGERMNGHAVSRG